jgi:hypothetical protein
MHVSSSFGLGNMPVALPPQRPHCCRPCTMFVPLACRGPFVPHCIASPTHGCADGFIGERLCYLASSEEMIGYFLTMRGTHDAFYNCRPPFCYKFTVICSLLSMRSHKKNFILGGSGRVHIFCRIAGFV